MAGYDRSGRILQEWCVPCEDAGNLYYVLRTCVVLISLRHSRRVAAFGSCQLSEVQVCMHPSSGSADPGTRLAGRLLASGIRFP